MRAELLAGYNQGPQSPYDALCTHMQSKSQSASAKSPPIVQNADDTAGAYVAQNESLVIKYETKC
jgi:hypothetical protein